MADPTEQGWEEEQSYRRQFLEEEVWKGSSAPRWCCLPPEPWKLELDVQRHSQARGGCPGVDSIYAS